MILFTRNALPAARSPHRLIFRVTNHLKMLTARQFCNDLRVVGRHLAEHLIVKCERAYVIDGWRNRVEVQVATGFHGIPEYLVAADAFARVLE